MKIVESPTLSVCIPCYNRPAFALEAALSSLNQSLQPIELLIGDDSPDDSTERALANLPKGNVVIRYWRHNKPLGQARNVQFLFEQARGDLISLMHDDDRYRPDTISSLVTPFRLYPDLAASFGKQVLIDEQGHEEIKYRDEFNGSFDRSANTTGLVPDSYQAAAIGMFPNNGYVVRRSLAQSIDYFDNNRASKACDYHFGLRLGALRQPFFFVNSETTDYRLTSISSARSGTDSGYYALKLLFESLQNEPTSPRIEKFIRSRIATAIGQGARIDRRRCLMWYFSKWHRSQIFSSGGLNRLRILFTP
jgi:glycosyltransferase involved in cell wall biosynthesis